MVAGVFNAQRTKQSDRYWRFTDFHFAHQRKKPEGRSGKMVIADSLTWYGNRVQWLDGYSPDSLLN